MAASNVLRFRPSRSYRSPLAGLTVAVVRIPSPNGEAIGLPEGSNLCIEVPGGSLNPATYTSPADESNVVQAEPVSGGACSAQELSTATPAGSGMTELKLPYGTSADGAALATSAESARRARRAQRTISGVTIEPRVGLFAALPCKYAPAATAGTVSREGQLSDTENETRSRPGPEGGVGVPIPVGVGPCMWLASWLFVSMRMLWVACSPITRPALGARGCP